MDGKSEATMVKALTEIVSVDIGQNLVSMSVVEKQNESGLKFNERLFIVVHGVFFGYISKVKMNDSPNKISIEEAKVKIPIKNLYSVEIVDEIMTIKFTIQENGKLVPKEWVLKTASAKLASFWKQLMEYELKMRKSPPKRQSSINPQKDKSKESSIISQASPQKKQSNSSLNVMPAQQTKRQSSESKVVFKRTPKVFQNPLFEDSDPEQDEKRPKRQSIAPQQSRIEGKNPPAPAPTPPQQKKVNAQQNKKPEEKKERVQKQVVRQQGKQQKSPEKNVKPEVKIEVKPEINANPSRKQSLIQLQLEKIQEQPVEDTPNIKNSKLKPPGGFSRSFNKSPQRKSEKPIKEQQQKISQKFDLGIKESQFINTVLKQLEEQNDKFPIQQLTYKHQDVQKIVKLYGRNLNQASNERNKTEKLLDYILQSQRQKIGRAIPKGDVPDGSPWTYKQFVLDEVDNLLHFQNKCKELIKVLYTQVHNREYSTFLKIKQENNIIYFQVEDLEVKLPLVSLRPSKNYQNINLLDHTAVKRVKKQFKYLKYLHSIIKNEENIRVPFSCLCQYGGIIALFKAKSVFAQQQSNQNIDKAIKSLEQKCKLSVPQLRNKIKSLKELYYNDLRHGDTASTFKYWMIGEVENLFPCDLNDNNLSHERQLRTELIEQECRQKSVVPYCSNQDMQNPNNKQDIKIISSLTEALNKRINQAISILNEGSFYFLNPSEISHFLHQRGINLRYLKTIYIKTNNSFVKSLLASQMISRSIKVLYRKTLQDDCFEKGHAKHKKQEFDNLLKEQCADFFNCIFGAGSESDVIWELINKNFSEKYEIRLESKQDLNKGQLLISTAYHCKIALDWPSIEVSEMFHSNQFLKKDNIKEIILYADSYEPASSGLKSEIEEKMNQVSYENFAYITNRLKLRSQKIPKELSFYRNFNNSLKVYLSNFIEPEQLDWANNYSHLSIFETSQPSIFSFKTQLCMIKWYLKSNKKHKYLNKFNEFSNRLSNIYGSNHPLLSEMYQIFSDHHKSKGEVEDSINFMKSALLNYSAILGDQNIAVTNSYFNLAKLLMEYNRLFEAEEYLLKAKQIMEQLRIDRSLLDGKIRLSLATLYFKDEKYKQSLDLVANKLDIFEQYETSSPDSFQPERAQIYQLIYYCQNKQNAKTECIRLCSHIETKLVYFKNHNNFSEVLFIIIESYINNLSAEAKQTMKRLINMIPTKISINFYKKSYDMILKRYQEKKLFDSFKKYAQNANKIVDMIVQKNLLKVWENLSKVYERQTLFDFISLVEELIYFLGRDRLNSI